MLAPDYQLHWSRNVTIQLNQLTKLERSIREKRFWDRPYLLSGLQLNQWVPDGSKHRQNTW